MTPGSGAWLAALCTSRVLAATWFVAYSAVLPLTQAEWGLNGREAGMVQCPDQGLIPGIQPGDRVEWAR